MVSTNAATAFSVAADSILAHGRTPSLEVWGKAVQFGEWVLAKPNKDGAFNWQSGEAFIAGFLFLEMAERFQPQHLDQRIYAAELAALISTRCHPISYALFTVDTTLDWQTSGWDAPVDPSNEGLTFAQDFVKSVQEAKVALSLLTNSPVLETLQHPLFRKVLRIKPLVSRIANCGHAESIDSMRIADALSPLGFFTDESDISVPRSLRSRSVDRALVHLMIPVSTEKWKDLQEPYFDHDSNPQEIFVRLLSVIKEVASGKYELVGAVMKSASSIMHTRSQWFASVAHAASADAALLDSFGNGLIDPKYKNKPQAQGEFSLIQKDRDRLQEWYDKDGKWLAYYVIQKFRNWYRKNFSTKLSDSGPPKEFKKVSISFDSLKRYWSFRDWILSTKLYPYQVVIAIWMAQEGNRDYRGKPLAFVSKRTKQAWRETRGDRRLKRGTR